METRLREGDDALGSDGGEPPRLSDGSPLPEDLARQVGFLERYFSLRQDISPEDAEACIARFIDGYPKYRDSWREKDLEAEKRDEQRDIWNYEGMEAMREAGV